MAVQAMPVASPDETFKLRGDLAISRQVQNGEVCFIVRDPIGLKYYRFQEIEHAIFSRLDGERSLEVVWAEVTQADPESGLGREDVAGFVRSLKRIGLLERTAVEQNLMLLEVLRDERKRKLERRQKMLSSIMFLTFHLWDPNRFFDRVIPYLRWLWTRAFVGTSLVTFAIAAYFNARGAEELTQGVLSLYGFVNVHWFDFATLWGLTIGSVILHEFGHGLTCKRFGGEVHDIGVIFAFFSPGMYCNVTDAYRFPERRHKLYVTSAGIFVDLWLWAVASVLWAFSLPGSGLHDFCFKVMVVCGFSAIALNFNPLMKLDGYYALIDLLGVANLRDNAQQYVNAWLGRHVFRREVAIPAVSPRLRLIYLVYGGLVKVYMTSMLVVLFFLIKNMTLGTLSWGGLPFFLLLVYVIYGSLIKRGIGMLKATAGKVGTLLQTWPGRLGLAGGLGALVAVLGLVQVPARLVYPVRLEPPAQLMVRAAVAGRVAEIRVPAGAEVASGQVVAVLQNPELETQLLGAQVQLRSLTVALGAARASGNLPGVAALEGQLALAQARVVRSERDRAALLIRSPGAGTLMAERPQDRLGQQVSPGTELWALAPTGQLVARVALPEAAVGDVQLGAPARVQLNGRPAEELLGHVRMIAPAAGAGPDLEVKEALTHYQVTVVLAAPPPGLRSGMTGRVKIAGATRSLAGHLRHWVSHTFNPDAI